MNRDELFNQIVDILMEYVEVDRADITLDTKFLADLHMNSLDIVTMVGDMEDRFDTTVETEDLDTIFTISDLIDYIEERA